MFRILGLAFLLFPLLTISLHGDDLAKARQNQAIQAQKIQAEAHLVFSQAKVLASYHPEKARLLLRDLKTKLEDDLSLPANQRQDLLAQVATRLREVGFQSATQKKAEEIASQQAADKYRREQERLYQQKLQSSGAFDAANNRIGGTKDAIAAAQDLQNRKNQAFGGSLNQVQESATQISRDVTFPRPEVWARISERSKTKLKPQEASLLKALNSIMAVDFQNTRLKDAINYLIDKTGQPIIVDDQALRDVMIEYDDPINFKSPGKITVRTILRKILADRGLGYIIREGNIQVVTAKQARENMTTRAYPINDLIFVDPRIAGPFTPYAMAQNAQGIINMIMTSVDPMHWQPNGGPGTIVYEPNSGSILVRASAEMHFMLGGSLSR